MQTRSMCLQPGRPTVSWAASKEGWVASRKREVTAPSTLPLEVLSGVLDPGLGPPAQGCEGFGGVLQEGHKDDQRAGAEGYDYMIL